MDAIRQEELETGRWSDLHPARNWSKADVRRLDVGGRAFVVKDYRPRAWPVRAIMGRWSLRREQNAYAALAGLPGIPRLAGRPHPHVLVLELVEGTSLAVWDKENRLPEGFFGRLKELVEQVHAHGVVQGDLHRRDVIIGGGGEVWLVDFSTALSGAGSGGPLRRWAWRVLARLDRRAVLKLQDAFEPGTLTDDERRELETAPRVYRWGKALGNVLRG